MNILHIASEYPPQQVFGLGRFVRDLAIAQAAVGHEVHVITNSMGGTDHDVIDSGVNVHRVDFPPPPKPADSGTMVMQFNIQALARFLKGDVCADADIVNAHDWLTAPVARLIARRIGARFVATVHDLIIGKTGGQLDNESKFIGNHEHAYCRSADLLLCVSEATRHEAIEHYGATPDRTFAIHNAVDPLSFPEVSANDLHYFRRALAPGDRQIVLYVGRLDAEKGIDTLVEAFDKLVRQGIDAHLVIAGKGALEAAIREDVKTRGHQDRVTFTGYVAPPALNHLFRCAAVHVVPSRYEPFGIVALEGMVCRRPVVASAVGGLREIIHDEESGRLVPPGDAPALATAIAEIIRDPDLALRLGIRARERVLETFTWPNVAKRIDSILAGQAMPSLTDTPRSGTVAHSPATQDVSLATRIMLIVQTHPPDFSILEHNRDAFTALVQAGHHVRFLCLQGEGNELRRHWRGIADVVEADAEPGHENLVRKTFDGYRRILSGNEDWNWLVKIDSDSFIAGDIVEFLNGYSHCDAVGKPSTFQPVIDAINGQGPPTLPANVLDRTDGRYLRGFFYGIRRERLVQAMPLLAEMAPRMRVEDATVTACLLAIGARVDFCDYLECYLSGRRDYDKRSPVLNVGSRDPDEIRYFAGRAKGTRVGEPHDESIISQTPRVAIVSQIRNRADFLLRMLQTAAPQWPQDGSVEWIVVDYGGTDDVAQKMRSLDMPELRYIYADQMGRFSSSHARNIGFQAARAPFILALDGDLLLPPDFLSSMHAAVASEPMKAIFGPVYKLMPDTQAQLEAGTLDGVRDFNALLEAARPHVIDAPAGAILGAPREAIVSIGGYDEGFTGYGFQDIDLVERLRRSGVAEHCPAGVFAVHQFHGYPSNYNTSEIETANRQRFLEMAAVVVRNDGMAWGRLPQGDIDVSRIGWLERTHVSTPTSDATTDVRDGTPIVWCDGVSDAAITAFLKGQHATQERLRWVTAARRDAERINRTVHSKRPQDRVECHSSAQVTTQFARAVRVVLFESATHARELRASANALGVPVDMVGSTQVQAESATDTLVGQEESIQTVLIAICEGLGNMIMLTPAIRALTDWLPRAEVHVVGKPVPLSLLAGMPRVKIIEESRPPLPLYDLVIVPGWGKAADGLLRRIKSRRPFVVGGKVATDRHETEQNLDLLRRIGWAGDMPPAYCATQPYQLAATSKRRAALVDTSHPKADWKRKRWPYYRELAQRFMDDGCTVYALGADCDAEDYRTRPWPDGVVDLQGKLELLETAGALSQMDLVIANDCGIGHMAAALETPTIAIFGPTSVEKNRPIGKNVRVLSSGIHCSPCQGTSAWHTCNEWRCINLLGMEQVLSAAEEMLRADETNQLSTEKPAADQRYLLAMPQADRETGYYIRRALEELGAEVTWFEPQIDTDVLLAAAEGLRPHVILCGREPGMAAAIASIRAVQPKVVTALWCMDVRERLSDFVRILGPSMQELFSNMDLIYTMAAGQVQEYQELAPQSTVNWLSQGIDPLVHRPEPVTDSDIQRYECDVLFCGSYRSDMHTDRLRLLAAIRKRFDLKLFGYETAIHHSEHNRACRSARIVLGNSAFPKIAKSMSVRDYKVMGAGGFLLTNHVDGIEDVFPVGEVCDTYRSVEECLEKIQYYLQHADERDRIASRAAEFVAANHTYTHRVANIVADVNERLQVKKPTGKSDAAPNINYWRKRYEVIGGERTVGPVDWKQPERYDEENERFAEIIRPYLPTHGTVLDLGCGIGRWVPLLSQHADAYRGCDIVESVVMDNQARYATDPQCEFSVYDGRHLPFGDTEFDWIWTCVVLQHITDDEVVAGLAEQFYQRLKPGGRIVLTENNLAHKSNHYLTFRTPEQYCRLFSRLNLKQVATWDFGINEPHGIFVGEKP